IQHVEQSGACPTQYAHRKLLKLDVRFLPSPDASSVFLIGFMGAMPTKLPRGQYALTLSFDPALAGLTPLEASAAVGPTPEVATLRFIQPSGLDWPLPSSKIRIPQFFVAALEKHLPMPPDSWRQLVDGPIDPTTLEQELTEALGKIRQSAVLPTPRPEPAAAGESQ